MFLPKNYDFESGKIHNSSRLFDTDAEEKIRDTTSQLI